MLPNTSKDISDSVAITPVKPEELKEKLYSALERYGYIRSYVPVAPGGYFDCVTQGGVEISAWVPRPKQELKVDISVLVNVPSQSGFANINYGEKRLLVPIEGQFVITQNNLDEVIDKLVDIGERGRKIVDENPDKRII